MGKEMDKFERIDSIKDRAICLVEGQINGDIANVDAKELGEIADIAKDMAETKKLCMEAKYYESIVEAMEDASTEEKMAKINQYMPETREWYGGMNKYMPGGMPRVYPMYYGGRGNYARRMRDSRGRFMYHDGMIDDDYGYDEMYPFDKAYYFDENEHWNRYPEYYGGRTGKGMKYMSGGYNGSGNSYYGGDVPRSEQMRDAREGRSGIRRRMYMEAKADPAKTKEEKQHELEEFMNELGVDMTEIINNMDNTEKAMLKQKLTQMAQKIG